MPRTGRSGGGYRLLRSDEGLVHSEGGTGRQTVHIDMFGGPACQPLEQSLSDTTRSLLVKVSEPSCG
jgi:hypothetical protein